MQRDASPDSNALDSRALPAPATPHGDAAEGFPAAPWLYRSAAIRRIEAAAMALPGIGGGSPDEDVLMQRAGQAAWRMLLAHWPQAQRIGIVCGPGNNGGDGYVLAALAQRSGRRVQVLRLSDDVRDGAARRAADDYLHAGGEVATFDPAAGLPQAEVWVDALFGIGLSRAPEGAAAALIQALNAQSAPIFALDVPSGIDADSGHAPGAAVQAARTLTFIAGKTGLYTGRGRVCAGEIALDALSLPAAVFDGIAPDARLLRADALAHWLRPRARDAHKGRFGTVLCVGGDHGMGGALALCAEAAHRTGAGLVRAATRAEHVPVLLARRPETMSLAIDSAQALPPLMAGAAAVAIGPGLGQGAWGADLLAAALDFAASTPLRPRTIPLVLDADALNILARGDARSLDAAVLTPHPGEAARLLGKASAAQIEADRPFAARALAARFDCAVVLKGAGTLVAAPGEVPVLIDAGNPGMASGGMGDALTGAIAALIAQGLPPFAAAACGALLHAAAGDAAAAEDGERGLLASDLMPQLRRLANPTPNTPGNAPGRSSRTTESTR